ncbi:MAG: M50 family metallopeptidase [archaeon]
MGNYESLAILLFIALAVYIFDRKNFRREGILFLRRTQRGLDIIDSIAKKHPKLITFLADAGIVFSFGLLGLRYLFIEKKTGSFNRIRHYASYFLLSSLFIYSIYGIFFVGIIDAFKIPVIYSGPVLSLLMAFTFLFGVSGYGFMTLFFGAVGILLSSVTGAVVESSIKLVLPVEVSADSDLPIFSVPIAEWLISILFILVVHEFSHAIVARKEGIRVKSLGYGFFGPMPLGFAEPDEKEIKKSSSLTKTRIFGAGSFSNILAASLILLLYFGTMTLGIFSGSVPLVDEGVYIRAVNSTMPAGILPVGGIITEVDGINTTNVSEFVAVMNTKGPDDNLTLIVDGKEYQLTLVEDPQNKTQGKMGIVVTQNRTMGPIGFFASLVNWLVLLNIGIALANLFPLRPLDGGLMLEEVLIGAGIKNRKEAAQTISKMTLALLLVSLLAPWLLSMFA